MLLPFLLGAAFLLYEWVLYRNAAARQQTTFGTITAHEPSNHSRYVYTFTVDGRNYQGWQIPEDSEKWAVGQQVVVYYDRVDPSRNALKDLADESENVIAPLPLVAVIITVILLISLRRKRGPRQTPG